MIVRVPAFRIAALGAALLGAAAVGARAAGVRSRPATRRHGGARRPNDLSGALHRISVGISGEGFDDSKGPSFSSDGRFQVFESAAPLADLDSNGAYDIYLKDQTSGVLQLISLSNPLIQGGAYGQTDNDSYVPTVSDDGRFIAFDSFADNIAGTDANGLPDIYVRDRRGPSIRASVSSTGTEANGASGGNQITADGQYVTYWSDATNLVSGDTNTSRDVFVTRLGFGLGTTGGNALKVLTTVRASVAADGTEADGASTDPSISADGRYVAFASGATNLVSDDGNNASDIFVKDMLTGAVERVSVASDGTDPDDGSYGPSISADGRYVAFVSDATNLVDDDTNGVRDVFVYDRETQTTERVSVGSDGSEGDFDSGAPVDSLPQTGISVIKSATPRISADGNFVVFTSLATTLAPGTSGANPQVYLRDRANGVTTELSASDAGVEGTGLGAFPAISADGSTIGFTSSSDDLVLDDSNGVEDVFVKTIGASSDTNQPPDVIVASVPDAVEGDLITLDASATSDPEGDALIFQWSQNVSPGDPVVTLADPTAAITTFTAPPVVDPITLEFDVMVSDGVNPPEIGSTFVTIGIAPPGVIEGQVTDSSGSPVPGAMITVVRDADGATSETVFADGSGNYIVSDARVGDDTITAISSGFEPVSQDVSVDAGSTNLLDIQLASQTAQVLGLVSYSDGSPVIGATIDLLGNSGGDATILATTQTESDGSYVLDDIDHTEIQAATAIRISSPGLIQWTDATGGLTPSAVNHRDYRYGRLQITIDAKPTKLRKQLNNSPVQLSNLVDSNGDTPTIVADKKTRKVLFPNVPAVSVKVKVTNPTLTGAQSTVQVRSGNAVTKLTLTLKPRGTF